MNPKEAEVAKSKSRPATPPDQPPPPGETAPDATPASPAKGPGGKLGQVVALLKRPEGASVEAISASTGWQTHSVRGAMSGALKKKYGLTILSEKTAEGARIYRILADSAQEPAA